LDLAIFHAGEMEDLISLWSRLKPPTVFSAAGTIAEYGLSGRLTLPVAEDAPLRGEGPYARGKIGAWLAGKAAFERHGFPLSWGVIPQLWGPGDSHGRDAAYVGAILDGKPVALRGHGRTLIPDGYVEHAARGLVHVVRRPEAAGRRANLAGLWPLTPLSFVRWIAAALGREVRIRHVPHRVMAAAQKGAAVPFRPVFGDYDLTLALTRLERWGFRWPFSAREGVIRTALWHAAHRAPCDPRFQPAPPFLEPPPPGTVEHAHAD